MEDRQATAELWRKRIEAQQARGMSIRAWCRENDIHEHGFYWWRTRLGLSPAGERRQRSSAARPVKFAEVVVAPPAITEPIRLRLSREGGDRELILPAGMPLADVAALVRAIEAGEGAS